MPRLHAMLFVSVILGLGVIIGFGARSLLDWSGGEPDASVSAGAPPGVLRQAAGQASAQAVVLPPAAPAAPRFEPPATAAAQDVVVEVTESQLEEELSGMLVGRSLGTTPLGEATVQTVSVQLRDSQIQVGGGARAGILQAPFVAAGTIEPDGGGRPRVKVSQASVGGVDLPEAMRAALAETLQERVNEFLGDRSVRIRTIDIANGRMRVVGTPGS
jgi:hypothetical protein